MRKIVFLSALAAALSAAPAFAQMPELQQKAIVLKRMIENRHYSPRPVDDSFALVVFRKMINTADRRRIYFSDADYKKLAAQAGSIDDELNGNGWAFTSLFSALYKKGLMLADSLIDKLAQKPFDLTINENMVPSKENVFVFPADNAAVASRLLGRMKLQLLGRIYDEMGNDTLHKTTFKEALAAKEASEREKVKLAEKKIIQKILDAPGGYEAYITDLYLGAIASCFDPHTNYFSAIEGERFQAELSTEVLAFGIELDENDKGQVIIGSLTPGGPAWKSGQLNEGDELLSLHWEGKEAVDVTGLTVEEAEDVLDESNHDKLLFKVKKADGTIATAFLKKEKIENEENIVKSFILKGEKKIGYILLPGFYTAWENETGSSCANDVAKEIIKLKRENIEGLVLDLRYNGGGSLGEAMEMAGIFIDEGPLFSIKDKPGKQTTLKDPNRGTIYDGPLAVMINGQSASASEALSAALQDYNRAVIVGSTTYGKATAQQMFSLDTLSNKAQPAPGKETVKITTGKLYRLTGGTAQFSGVAPDVVLPDAFDALDYREKFSMHALLPDSAKRNSYYKALQPLPVKALSDQSRERIAKVTGFNEVKKFIDDERRVIKARENPIPLKWDLFEKWIKDNDPEEGPPDNLKPTSRFTVENHAKDKELLVNNPDAAEINKIWMEGLTKDIYVEETFAVLTDLIRLLSSPVKN